MCTVDIGVFDSVRAHRSHPYEFVDFNTRYIYMNFEQIKAWVEENQLPEDLLEGFWETPGEDITVWDLAL
jgi:hypothetical protein